MKQLFKDINEMNEAIRTHRQNNELNKTEVTVLELLARYSCKDVGRSFLSKSTIAELVGKSRRTIIRVCNRLEELGIIHQYARKRQTGDRRQTSNLIVILSIQSEGGSEKTEHVTPKCHTQEAPSRNNNKNTLLDTANSHPRALRQSIPKVIYDALAPFFNADELYKTYGVLLRAKAKINKAITVEEHGEDYVDVFYNVVRKYKRGKVGNLDGYLFTAWEQVTAEISRKLAVSTRPVPFYNWLEG
ncbi:helix-turn-helix domain-containing protein [Mesobacillus maritimus]|uniref:helix-turn-helix domain-containing protein n=1 Tax=Mesobacillus maritimus TaxID=1643336 RepID=UPI0020414480|nr:helix-turn-helix domain-containing protein [Mesobacillus maritimus]MCM3668017.1 helix-turn-helix domain-containing protein [Mesobacillus maritimus]